MRIDGFRIDQLNNYSVPAAQNTPNKASEKSAKAFDIVDTYERGNSNINADFGGYDRNGRLSGSKYALDGVANILNTDEGTVRMKMSSKGLEPEDLIYPEKTVKLSDEPDTQAKLSDFALNMRADLMADTGMSESELGEFINAVR